MGKIMAAISLASSTAMLKPKQPPLLLDCGGETPETHLFLHFPVVRADRPPAMNPQYNSASCFACGLENPSGLRLRFYDNGQDQVNTDFVIDAQHAGYPGMAHGGIVAAILDEVGGRTVMINHPNRFFVTARIDIRYRHPVPVGVPLEAAGWMLKRRARRTRAHAEIYGDGKGLLTEADILYTDLPPNLLDPVEARISPSA
jgi:uncharacterized protein (TIGR00369 family)